MADATIFIFIGIILSEILRRATLDQELFLKEETPASWERLPGNSLVEGKITPSPFA
jgi:hypothetical protein